MAAPNEINELLDMLGEYYGNAKDMTLMKRGLYIQALSDLDAGVLMNAAAEYIKTGKWFPKVAELREIAKRQHGAAAIDPQVDDERDAGIMAMGRALWDAYCYGEVTWQQLESDRAWLAYQKLLPHNPAPTADEQARLDAAWTWAVEETERWMAADYGADWRTAGARVMQEA